MKKGVAKVINFHNYIAPNFDIYTPVFRGALENTGCGGHALAVLTGRPYKEISKLSKNDHWPDRTMFNYLKKHGYEVIPITLATTAEAVTDYEFKRKLSSFNVLLLDQRVVRYESTWAVVWGGWEAHSGDLSKFDALQLLYNPVHAAYVIWHKKWAIKL